jgi:parvulin-like peptidyl-prolyl isomerase
MKFPMLLTLGVVCLPVLAADVRVVEEIIAKVNGEIVTRGDLDRTRRQTEAELTQRGIKGPALEQAMRERERDVLRDRIDNLLLINRAKELNINVDAEVSRRMAEIQRQQPGLADPDKFQAWIREQTGMPFEDFKAEMRNSMLTERVIRQEIGDKIRIPRQEIEKYYEEHKQDFVREEKVFLREILISTEGKDAAGIATAEKKAKDLVARARKGEKFHELARENSDAVSAQQYGDLGGWKKGELDPEIEKVVWDKEKNYVTDPLKRANGFLILKIEDHQRAGQAQLEEVESEIMEILYRPLFQPKIRAYLTKLRQDSFLEIRVGYVDTAAAPGKDTRWTDPAQLKPETVTKEEVASQTRRRRLFWLIPIPGTSTTVGETLEEAESSPVSPSKPAEAKAEEIKPEQSKPVETNVQSAPAK